MKGPAGKTPQTGGHYPKKQIGSLISQKNRTPNNFNFANDKEINLSDAAMSSIMKRVGIDARPNGFRSTLRTWIAETQSVSLEVAEVVLTHRPASTVVRAYERTDFLDQRKEITNNWAAFLCV